MEPLMDLLVLLEPAQLTLIVTAVGVTFGSAFRAMNHAKETKKNQDFPELSFTLNTLCSSWICDWTGNRNSSRRSDSLSSSACSSLFGAFDVGTSGFRCLEKERATMPNLNDKVHQS